MPGKRKQGSEGEDKRKRKEKAVVPVAPTPALEGFVVGVCGHRKLGSDTRVLAYVSARCVELLFHLRHLAEAQGTGLVATTTLAIGADTLFAEAAIGLGVPLVGVMPFRDYGRDFEGPDRHRFETLQGLCTTVHKLPHRGRSAAAYAEAGKWIVDQSDVLVAISGARPSPGTDHTAGVVEYARTRDRLILRIDPKSAPGASVPRPAKVKPSGT